MKVLSGPEGDGLVTNAEVQAWLKEKNFEIDKRDLKKGAIRPPSSTASLARDIRHYLESSPSGMQTVAHVGDLYKKLEKFNLSAPEKLMIANIRPEAYAHLTPLLVNVYSRFDEDQLYEILEIINNTLPRRRKHSDPGGGQKESGTADLSVSGEAGVGEIAPVPGPVDATALDISSMAVTRAREHRAVLVRGGPAAASSGKDATILDYSAVMQSSQATVVQSRSFPSRGSTARENN